MELRLPHPGFNRAVGTFAPYHVSPDGRLVDEETWRSSTWLPTDADQQHVRSLMTGVFERGQMAGWIAPPASGINQKPVDYDYVRV
jgi:benzoyl-CoA 2,3-dioxygenase component B